MKFEFEVEHVIVRLAAVVGGSAVAAVAVDVVVAVVGTVSPTHLHLLAVLWGGEEV